MARKTRRRVEHGIYIDEYGYSAIVIKHKRRRERRFPNSTPLRIIRTWREDEERRLRQSTPAPAARGTLEADVARYLNQVKHLASHAILGSVLKAWTDRYGDKPRWALTAEDIRLTRIVWQDAGIRPKTINNRVEALRRLYRVLDGPRTWSPCDDVGLLPVDRQPTAYVTQEIIRATYAGLVKGEQNGTIRDSKTRARFMVLASSGVRASELMRAQPGDIDLERRVWLTRDGKGGFRTGGGVYLTSDLLAAWKVFIAAEAWGEFNTGSMAKVLRTAGWPKGVRPYQMRATVGLAMSEAGVDLADISAVLGHSRPLTTRSHYVSVLSGRLRAAIETIDARIGWPEPTADAITHAPVSADTPRNDERPRD